MICSPLPDVGGPAVGWLLAGLACVLLGWLLVWGSRGPGSRGGYGRGLVVLALGAGGLVALGSAGQAVESCEGDPTSPDPAGRGIVIVQTSVITGLAPGKSPTPITGTVTNLSFDPTRITDVTVRITAVTKANGASAGACSAGDYVLVNARMPVARTLPRLSSVTFAGAALGFDNSSRNQDACKLATVHLGYVSR